MYLRSGIFALTAHGHIKQMSASEPYRIKAERS